MIEFNNYTESNWSLWRFLFHVVSGMIPTMKNWSVEILYLLLKQISKPGFLLGYKVRRLIFMRQGITHCFKAQFEKEVVNVFLKRKFKCKNLNVIFKKNRDISIRN